MTVIASIHQPSTSTLQLFDNVLLLSKGETVYYGPPKNSREYFRGIGYPVPENTSIGEFMVELSNADFEEHNVNDQDRLERLHRVWQSSIEGNVLQDKLKISESKTHFPTEGLPTTPPFIWQCAILLHRMMMVRGCLGD